MRGGLALGIELKRCGAAARRGTTLAAGSPTDGGHGAALTGTADVALICSPGSRNSQVATTNGAVRAGSPIGHDHDDLRRLRLVLVPQVGHQDPLVLGAAEVSSVEELARQVDRDVVQCRADSSRMQPGSHHASMAISRTRPAARRAPVASSIGPGMVLARNPGSS